MAGTLDSKRSQSFSQMSDVSHTAQEYIQAQLALEEEAREALPYQFDTCTRSLGPLRQTLFSCLTCNPPPGDPSEPYSPAGVCYSCSISCHGEHELVELFTRRNFVCDCGTRRVKSASPCTLRVNEQTGNKGEAIDEEPSATNTYNHNFRNRFCACGDDYDPHKENRTMFQCLGLGTVQDGGCGEDWWHPECLLGMSRPKNEAKQTVDTVVNAKASAEPVTTIEGHDGDADEAQETPLPPGFPPEDSFEHVLCYKCTAAFPWVKRYAGAPGFLPPVIIKDSYSSVPGPARLDDAESKKRKAADGDEETPEVSGLPDAKRVRSDQEPTPDDPASQAPSIMEANALPACRYATLPPPPEGQVTLFLNEDFRDSLCRCPSCFPKLARHAQLLEEEESYEPPMSESSAGDGGGRSAGGSTGQRSLLDRGEAALSNMDRVRAIEGVMVYNNLRDKVKAFLKPFAESGQAVGAEDVKEYFEKLRGDDEAIKRAAAAGAANGGEGGDTDGGNRKKQSGY